MAAAAVLAVTGYFLSAPLRRPAVIQGPIRKRGGYKVLKEPPAFVRLPDGSVGALAHGEAASGEIALTFDDGPHPPFTQKLLALLVRLQVPATFFVVGEKVERAPCLLREMLHDGDEIGNHTYHHFNLKYVPPGLVGTEILLNNDAIRRACGCTPLFFRPSGGQYRADVLEQARIHHMVTALWTDDPADYAMPGSAMIEQRLLAHVRPGAIILLHDGIQQTYDILPDFVARMRRRGYVFVTLSQMLETLETWPLVSP